MQGIAKKAWPSEAVYEAVKDGVRGLPHRPAEDGWSCSPRSPEDAAAAARVGQLFVQSRRVADDAYRQRKRRAGVARLPGPAGGRPRPAPRPRRTSATRSGPATATSSSTSCRTPTRCRWNWSNCSAAAGWSSGKLFAVGDHKQSIYRFRGAEVGLFQGLRDDVAAEGRLGLTLNFRSQPAVLHFVNALFSKRVPDYEPLEAHHPPAGDAANVEFLWSPGEREASARRAHAHQGADAPLARIRAAVRAEADAIASRIAGLLADPTPRVLDETGAAAGRAADVVLLFRSMSNVAIYEAALRRHGLDYYLVGGRAFFAQQEMYDLLNLLRALENPQDAVSLVGTLRSPFCCLSATRRCSCSAAHPDGLWAGLHDDDRLDHAAGRPAAGRGPGRRGSCERWRAVKDRLPIARLLNAVFADSGYDAAMQFEFLGDRKLANLWKLLDLARTFDRSGLFGLAEFIGPARRPGRPPAARGAGRHAAGERRRRPAHDASTRRRGWSSRS